MSDKIETIVARYDFTEHELRDLSKVMADTYAKLEAAEDNKKAVVGELSTGIKELEMKLREVSRKVYSGFENRAFKAQWKMNDPAVGQKSLYREDAVEGLFVVFVKASEMSHEEKQMQLIPDGPVEVEAEVRNDGKSSRNYKLKK